MGKISPRIFHSCALDFLWLGRSVRFPSGAFRLQSPKEAAEDPVTRRTKANVVEYGTRDREGSVGLRFFLAASMTPGSDVVPFYFQPTLGGMDINGNPSLSSYQDFRFRAPNVMFFRQSLEHSIWGPLGFSIMADEGKVGLTRGDLGSNPWVHSFASGLTLRAGGFPQVYLLFAWGGNEGTHTIANVNTSLLGGASRPSAPCPTSRSASRRAGRWRRRPAEPGSSRP